MTLATNPGNENVIHRIVIESSSIDIQAALTTNHAQDEVVLRPQCTGEGCTMDFGGMSSPGTWHLSDQELDFIIANGKLFIGDRDTTINLEMITFDGISYAYGDAGIFIEARYTNAEIAFSDTATTFDSTTNEEVFILAAGDITSSALVTLDTTLNLIANHDCHSELKGLEFSSSGGFVAGSNPVTIYTSKTSFVVGNMLSAGTDVMRIKEMCWIGDLPTNGQQSIGLGASEQEVMELSQTELMTLTASTLFFESDLGSMIVHGIDQATDLPNISIHLMFETKHSSNKKEKVPTAWPLV
eukprot:TRINITY_DN2474_c0_g1_i1.p1 TRINITY_DN2474_c0_g1~~TRINITY_DN2474_c0_g1_i1.p1  ORF type:complete len:299 (+),score=55.83 TRINITY_DN2474_c0_g1_i1:1022-1918(+)